MKKTLLERVKRLEERLVIDEDILNVFVIKVVNGMGEAPMVYTHAVCNKEHFQIEADETEEAFEQRVVDFAENISQCFGGFVNVLMGDERLISV